jgi:hypothetical protein
MHWPFSTRIWLCLGPTVRWVCTSVSTARFRGGALACTARKSWSRNPTSPTQSPRIHLLPNPLSFSGMAAAAASSMRLGDGAERAPPASTPTGYWEISVRRIGQGAKRARMGEVWRCAAAAHSRSRRRSVVSLLQIPSRDLLPNPPPVVSQSRSLLSSSSSSRPPYPSPINSCVARLLLRPPINPRVCSISPQSRRIGMAEKPAACRGLAARDTEAEERPVLRSLTADERWLAGPGVLLRTLMRLPVRRRDCYCWVDLQV